METVNMRAEEPLEEPSRREFRPARAKIFWFALFFFLVATLSFGLGYLANGELNRAPIIIEKCPS